MLGLKASSDVQLTKHAAWCQEAYEALRGTFVGADGGLQVLNGVRCGRMELWRVNGDSWAVTEIMRGMLFIWCYAGRGSNEFVLRMVEVARKNKLEQVSFFSFHAGAGRLWKRFNPRMVPGTLPGEVQYVFEVKT